MSETIIPFLITIVVILVLILISVIFCPTPKLCQKNQQEPRQSESPFDTNVEILTHGNRDREILNLNLPSESSPKLQVDLDMPPSYSVLFGKE